MKKPDININEAVKIYKKEGSLHKTAKILHTSHIRLSNLFKDNNIKIENIGKKEIYLLMMKIWLKHCICKEKPSVKYLKICILQ